MISVRSVWRMWFCTTSPDQLLASALCYRGQRSFWSPSPVGPLRSSPPGSLRPQTAACPSDPPGRHPSSPAPRAGCTFLPWSVSTLRRPHLKVHRTPKTTSRTPKTASSQPRGVTEPSGRSPDRLPMRTRQPGGPGVSLCGDGFCRGAPRRCPSSSITRCPSTGSTSTRGSSG